MYLVDKNNQTVMSYDLYVFDKQCNLNCVCVFFCCFFPNTKKQQKTINQKVQECSGQFYTCSQ